MVSNVKKEIMKFVLDLIASLYQGYFLTKDEVSTFIQYLVPIPYILNQAYAMYPIFSLNIGTSHLLTILVLTFEQSYFTAC